MQTISSSLWLLQHPCSGHGCSCVDECIPMLEEVRKAAEFGDFPSGPAVRTPNSPFRGLGSIPGQGTTRSCLLQLRSRAAKLKKKVEELLALEPGLPDALYCSSHLQVALFSSGIVRPAWWGLVVRQGPSEDERGPSAWSWVRSHLSHRPPPPSWALALPEWKPQVDGFLNKSLWKTKMWRRRERQSRERTHLSQKTHLYPLFYLFILLSHS